MTRIINSIITGLMSLCFIAIAAQPVQAVEGAPKAILTQEVYDFGIAYEGVDAIQDIGIKNEGDADLEIIRIGTG